MFLVNYLENNYLSAKMILLWLILLGHTVRGFEVIFTGEWVPGAGAELNCSWIFPEFDSLQSVKMYYDSIELTAYRPEIHGRQVRLAGRNVDNFEVFCSNSMSKKNVGYCIITNKMEQNPPRNASDFDCEVSGERPWFKVVTRNYTLIPFVASSGASLEATENSSGANAALNCSAMGLPAPGLHWNVGDRQITADFKGSYWNTTSKIWQVWSSITLTKTAKSLQVTCLPKQESSSSRELEAPSAAYTLKSVNSSKRSAGNILTCLALLATLSTLR